MVNIVQITVQLFVRLACIKTITSLFAVKQIKFLRLKTDLCLVKPTSHQPTTQNWLLTFFLIPFSAEQIYIFYLFHLRFESFQNFLWLLQMFQYLCS